MSETLHSNKEKAGKPSSLFRIYPATQKGGRGSSDPSGKICPVTKDYIRTQQSMLRVTHPNDRLCLLHLTPEKTENRRHLPVPETSVPAPVFLSRGSQVPDLWLLVGGSCSRIVRSRSDIVEFLSKTE